jgi:hypothetical protein
MKRILALLLLLLLPAVALAGEPAKEGDDALGVSYGVAATDVDFDNRTATLGATWAHWWTDKVTTEVDAFFPRNQPGDWSMSLDAAYHFGPVFLEGGATYLQNDAGFQLNAGPGLNFWAGERVNLVFVGRVIYNLDAAAEEDRTTWQTFSSLRFKF